MDKSRIFIIVLLVTFYSITMLYGYLSGEVKIDYVISKLEPYIAMIMGLMFGESSALRRPNDDDIKKTITDNISELKSNMSEYKNVNNNNNNIVNPPEDKPVDDIKL